MRRVIIYAVVFLFLGAQADAYAFWIWKPKQKTWINPKHVVKPTPAEQLKYAKTLYEQAKYKEALEEFRALLKFYPKAFEASEAQYYIGLTLDAQHQLYEAFKAYQKVIDKYPFSQRIDDILERQFKIGEAFLSGEKRKAMGIELPVENPAIEIFRAIVENSTYGKLAAKAQYMLGMVLKNTEQYQQARDEFERVASNYPESEWVVPAKFQAAECASLIAPKAEYDQEVTKKAKEEFEEFVKTHPDANLSQEAEAKIDSLKEKEAEGNLMVAEFYEKQKKWTPARVYYQAILDSCPQCKTVDLAREKLKELEGK